MASFIICTWQIAKQEQGKSIEEHIAKEGQLGSQAVGFGIGTATAAIIFVVTVAAFQAYQYRNIVMIGTKDQVIYSGLATKADATALGNALKSSQYFQEHGASVLFNKGFGSTTVSFVVQDGIWNQTGVLSSFEELAREVAPAVGGLPVQVQLVDTSLDVKDKSTVGIVRFDGNDAAYYEGSATKAEAQALGQQLQSMGFFQGKGANVLLIRHYGGTTLAFAVAEEAWRNPGKISGFEKIVRQVAPTIGGLPIEMHLVDTQLKVMKDELIEGNQGE